MDDTVTTAASSNPAVPSATGQPRVSAPTPPAAPPTAEASSPRQGLRDRRREKPMLSCTFCRTRKVRCDRQLPCNTCTSKGIGLTCMYVAGTARRRRLGVGDRIQELEAMVRTLMEQQKGPGGGQVQTQEQTPVTQAQSQTQTPRTYSEVKASLTTASSALASSPAAVPSSSGPPSPAPSDQGSMRPHAHGGHYVGSGHWAAVLDSISELRDHYEEELEAKANSQASAATGLESPLPSSQPLPLPSPAPPTLSLTGTVPRLLYEPVQATRAEILASLPERRALDRVVAGYFHAQTSAPIPVLHSGQFLREYEAFWRDPESVSFLWLALLFSILSLASQFHEMMDSGQKHAGATEGSPQNSHPHPTASVHHFRDRLVQCLVLGQYTRGGDHVLPTLINYIVLEIFLCKDADIGVWLVLGVTVQLALSMGYHRDASNFGGQTASGRPPRPNPRPEAVSPFAAEMRRRVWATIVQMDLRLSSQMGFPRLLRLYQCDTAEPRNLLDTDFDQDCTELPPARPETEITPVLYVLAKNRIDGIGSLIADFLADTRAAGTTPPYPNASSPSLGTPLSVAPDSPSVSAGPSAPLPSPPPPPSGPLDSQIMVLDRTLDEAVASLPTILRWQPLSQAFMLPSSIVMQRIPLQLAVMRLRIWLHRRYLAPAYACDPRYSYSRKACIEAAMQILEFQRLVHDETTHPDGLLYPLRWMIVQSLHRFVWLLGMGTLCYYLQLVAKTRCGVSKKSPVSLGAETDAKIYSLLRNSYPLWLRSSKTSREARLAVDHLSRVLGLPGWQESVGNDEGAPKDNRTTTDTTPLSTTVAITTDTAITMGNTAPSSESALSTPLNDASMSIDQAAWDVYQDCIINFPSTPGFGADFLTASASLPPTDNFALEDLMLGNTTTNSGDWMEVRFP